MAPMRRLSDLGERELIKRIVRLAGPSKSAGVVLGIGDDAAILRSRNSEDIVTSTDAAIENVHFRWSTQSARHVGRRALISNLSDLAAMGARPLGFVLALSAPPSLALSRFDGLFGGLLAEARTHACPLVGGNLSRSRQTMLSITVLGTVTRGQALRRDRLRVGDDLYLTGQLGGSALALARSERARSVMRWIPVPRLKAGQALARFKGHGACIDVSDGLIPDLERLLDASGVGAEIDAKSIPMPRGYRAACDRLGLDANSLSLAGGEDYELLFSLRSQVSKQISVKGLSHRLGVEVTRIGSVTRRLGIVGLPSVSGFRHY